MSFDGPQFESKDNDGSTTVESGTATTTPASVPLVAGKVISGYAIDNLGSNSILVSFDGGTTFRTIEKKSYESWNIKGSITQIVVKTLSSTSGYEIMLNLEAN